MVRWWLLRIAVVFVAFGLSANCSVDEDDYRFDADPNVGSAGDDGSSDGGGRAAMAGSSSGSGRATGGNDGDHAGAGGEPTGAPGDAGSTAVGGEAGDAATGAGGLPGTTGGSGGASVGGSGTTGGTGTAGSTSGAEDCSNGVDDDDDGDSDCEDSDCGARVCVPNAPALWSGPILIYEGPAAAMPECSGDVGVERFEAGTVPVQDALGCTACSCSGVSDGTCTLANRTYNDEACVTLTSTANRTTECAVPITSTAFRFDGFTLSGGSCSPVGGGLTSRPAPRWQAVSRGCGLDQPENAGCGNGSTCMSEPVSPFEDEVCVFRTGDYVCPSAYPSKRSYATSFDDQRSCSTCSCRPPTACTATLTGYDSQQCTTDDPSYTSGPVPLGAVGSCQRFEDFSLLAMRLTDVEYPGGCAPVAAVSTQGSVVGEDPITVCCL